MEWWSKRTKDWRKINLKYLQQQKILTSLSSFDWTSSYFLTIPHTFTHARARTYTRTHACTRTNTHTHTHKHSKGLLSCSRKIQLQNSCRKWIPPFSTVNFTHLNIVIFLIKFTNGFILWMNCKEEGRGKREKRRREIEFTWVNAFLFFLYSSFLSFLYEVLFLPSKLSSWMQLHYRTSEKRFTVISECIRNDRCFSVFAWLTETK